MPDMMHFCIESHLDWLMFTKTEHQNSPKTKKINVFSSGQGQYSPFPHDMNYTEIPLCALIKLHIFLSYNGS